MRQTHLRLAAIDGVRTCIDSIGYRSGRKRWRETPDMDSIASTLSAGTRPSAIQPETLPCDLRPRARAKALCPPTASHASNSASVLIAPINAQTVNRVNAYSDNPVGDTRRMPRRPKQKPSPFWERLAGALGEKFSNETGLELNPNSLAKSSWLRMSQGSVRRWFTGEGFPELDTAIELATRGGVCVEWLLTARKPKYPLSKDPVLRALFDVCEDLLPKGREQVLHAATSELALQEKESGEDSHVAQRG